MGGYLPLVEQARDIIGVDATVSVCASDPCQDESEVNKVHCIMEKFEWVCMRDKKA